MINGILCEIIPVEDVFWRFAESGLITQLTRDEIKAVHEVAEYHEAGIFHEDAVLVMHHNCTTRRKFYAAVFHTNGTLGLTALSKSNDQIVLEQA